MTRIQQERFADSLDYERVKNAYILKNKMLENGKKKSESDASAYQG
ncbi:MAG: hypothetical protein MZV63_10320 [Marinilabiliales bacterium]|nr:hypothetical protein [Marinilabiliales bacterium]